MKKKLLKYLGLGLASLSLAFYATAMRAKLVSAFVDHGFYVPLSANGVATQNLELVGSKSADYLVSADNSAGKLITTSGSSIPGVLLNVVVSTGAATDYVVCSDSSTANSTMGSGNGNLFQPLFANTTNTTSLRSGGGQSYGVDPAFNHQFAAGLNCWASAAGVGFTVKYRLNTPDGQ